MIKVKNAPGIKLYVPPNDTMLLTGAEEKPDVCN